MVVAYREGKDVVIDVGQVVPVTQSPVSRYIYSSAETKGRADQTCRCVEILDHREMFPARWTLTGSVIGAAKLQDTRQTRMTTFLRLAMCGSGERNCAFREGRQVPREFRSQISRGNPKG